MADQVQVTKLNQYINIGPPADSAGVSKLVTYMVLAPSDLPDDTFRAVHVRTRIIRRS